MAKFEALWKEIMVSHGIEFTKANYHKQDDLNVQGWAGSKVDTTLDDQYNVKFKATEMTIYVRPEQEDWVWIHELGHQFCNHTVRGIENERFSDRLKELEADAVALYVYRKMKWKTPAGRPTHFETFFMKLLDDDGLSTKYKENSHPAVKHVGEWIYKKLKERGIK